MMDRAGACCPRHQETGATHGEGCLPAAPPVNVRAFTWCWPRVRECLSCGMDYEAASVRTRCPRCGFVEAE